MTTINPKHMELITVEMDGEEKQVHNRVNLMQPAEVRGTITETYEARIGAGDGNQEPEAITEWVAEKLWHEFGIDPAARDFEVIDVTADDVTII